MSNKSNIVNQLSNIQESLDCLFENEIVNFLEDLSFNYGYIQLALENTDLDKHLQYAIANPHMAYDRLQSMIDILS